MAWSRLFLVWPKIYFGFVATHPGNVFLAFSLKIDFTEDVKCVLWP